MDRHIPTSVLVNALKGTEYILSEPEMHSEGKEEDAEPVALRSYAPLFLVFGYIALTSVMIEYSSGEFQVLRWMGNFMAGFFLVFSFFKLLDLPAFAMSYSSYDIIAKRIYAYGYVYPFLELLIGLSFLFPAFHYWSSISTVILMSVSIAGVIQSLLKKSRFQCASLGAVFKLPLSKITLLEDGLMIVMSVFTLYILK
jgi:hypothetical protein